MAELDSGGAVVAELDGCGAAVAPSKPSDLWFIPATGMGEGKLAIGDLVLSCCLWYSWQSLPLMPAIVTSEGFQHGFGHLVGILQAGLNFIRADASAAVEWPLLPGC